MRANGAKIVRSKDVQCNAEELHHISCIVLKGLRDASDNIVR